MLELTGQSCLGSHAAQDHASVMAPCDALMTALPDGAKKCLPHEVECRISARETFLMRKTVLKILSRTKPYLYLAWPLCAVLAAALLWTNIVGNARAEREAARAQLLQQTAAYSQAYALYLTRSFAQMDQITMQLKHSWEHTRRASLLEDMKA